MKKLPFVLFALVAASFALSANAAELVAPAAPAARTAALFASCTDIQVSQVAIVVDPNRRDREYRNDGYNHRRYRSVRVVTYRHGVRYVSYRRVYN